MNGTGDERDPYSQDWLHDNDREVWEENDARLNPGGVRAMPRAAGPSLADVMAANALVAGIDAVLQMPGGMTTAEKVEVLLAVRRMVRLRRETTPSLPCPCCGAPLVTNDTPEAT